jgi:peptidoglycan hydrolase CwlO-like protein
MARAGQRVTRAAAATLVLVVGLFVVITARAEASPVRGVASSDVVLASPQASLEELQAEAREMRATMTRLETEMVDLTEQWKAARLHLDEVNVALVTARRQLERAESDLEQQRRLLASRMITMYKMGEPSWLDVVAASSSMADAQVVMDLMGRISELDKEQEVELHRLTVTARRLEQQVQDEREEAISAQAEIDARRAEMNQKIAEREEVLKDVVARIKKILAAPELLMSAGGKVTQLTWAQAFLKALNMRLTVDNVAAIVAWEMAEGGHWYNTAHYNPLNTSQPMPGARTFNSHGVKIYNSWAQGLRATVITINNGFYGGILAALREGNDGQAVAAAVAASPWGTGPFHVRS